MMNYRTKTKLDGLGNSVARLEGKKGASDESRTRQIDLSLDWIVNKRTIISVKKFEYKVVESRLGSLAPPSVLRTLKFLLAASEANCTEKQRKQPKHF